MRSRSQIEESALDLRMDTPYIYTRRVDVNTY